MISQFSVRTLFTLAAEMRAMSIDRERFEEADEDELVELSVPEQVLGFLAVHEDRAFEAREIPTQTGLEAGAVSTALSRLKTRGLVEHKATFWAVTDDQERLEGYRGYERASALFDEQLGAEDRDDWRDHATEEQHPSVESGADQ